MDAVQPKSRMWDVLAFAHVHRRLRMSSAVAQGAPSLAHKVEQVLRQTTHGRIRDLAVEEVQGQVVVRGHAPSHHMRQVALHAALELVESERFRSLLTVG
jgi:hypothetical protein